MSAGFQATVSFPPGTPQEAQAVDLMAPEDMGLWRVSAISLAPVAMRARIIYGTSSSFRISNLRLPLVAYVPGACQLYLAPDVSPVVADINVRVSATLITNGLQVLRTFHDSAAAAVLLPPSAMRYTALTASTVTIEGIAVAVAVGTDILLTAPSTLTAGAGIAEHEL